MMVSVRSGSATGTLSFWMGALCLMLASSMLCLAGEGQPVAPPKPPSEEAKKPPKAPAAQPEKPKETKETPKPPPPPVKKPDKPVEPKKPDKPAGPKKPPVAPVATRPVRMLPAKPKKPEMPPDIRDQTNANYLADLAQVHMRYGAAERAMPLLERALENAKHEGVKARIHNQLGSYYQNNQDWANAAKHFEGAMGLYTNASQKANAAMTLARIYESMGQQEKAEKILLGLMEKGDEAKAGNQAWVRRSALQRLVRLWKAQPGRLDTVIKDSEAALAKDPKDEDALDRLAEIYSNVRRDPKKAIEVYEKLKVMHPGDARINQWLASLYQQNREPDKAIGIYKELHASASKGTKSHYAYQISQLMIQTGKKDEAIDFAKQNLVADEKDSSQLSLLASFYERAGMREDAEATLVKALDLARTDLQRATYRLRIADSQKLRKDYAGAEKNIRAAIKEAGKNRVMVGRAKNALVQLYKLQNKMDELKLGGE